MKKEKSCGVICFKADEASVRVLLIRHRFGGHWSFPKGHVEKGEAEAETALRELFEETGANAELLSGYREVISYSPAKNVLKDVVFFVGELTNKNFICQPDEISELALLPLATAYSRLTFETDKLILKKAELFYLSYKAKS